MNDKPGTDWQAKHDSAGQHSGRPQHESWTTADGPVNQRAEHNHPMSDDQVSKLIDGK